MKKIEKENFSVKTAADISMRITSTTEQGNEEDCGWGEKKTLTFKNKTKKQNRICQEEEKNSMLRQSSRKKENHIKELLQTSF